MQGQTILYNDIKENTPHSPIYTNLTVHRQTDMKSTHLLYPPSILTIKSVSVTVATGQLDNGYIVYTLDKEIHRYTAFLV